MARILVVDDEPRVVSFLSRALTAQGYGVDSATSGEQALKLAFTGIFDLVVLDLRLPDRDGTEVLAQLMQARPSQAVLVVSARAATEDKITCLQLGAADYVVKPFALSELLARVQARLRERRNVVTHGHETFVAGRIVLDPKLRTADAGRGPVHLSEREFRVFEHLVRNGGKVCSREELLAEIWGYWFDPGSNVVEVIVGRLRSKLGSDVIDTVRHAGYRAHVR